MKTVIKNRNLKTQNHWRSFTLHKRITESLSSLCFMKKCVLSVYLFWENFGWKFLEWRFVHIFFVGTWTQHILLLAFFFFAFIA